MKNVWVLLMLFALHAGAAVDLQTTADDQEFAEKMATLDLNCSTCKIKYKNTGTSVGIKIKLNGEKGGKFVPENSATSVEGQVVAYNLARYLYMSELVIPSAYYTLRGQALSTFKSLLQAANEKNKWRKQNRDSTLQAIAKNPSGLLGVYTEALEGGSPEVQGLANSDANTINSSHAIAKFIKSSGPRPSADKKMSLAGVKSKDGSSPKESELELARQFSKIMVLDILMGQWDRFSGGNIEATIDGGRMYFIARDNGGTSMRGTSYLKKYFGIVTRFDRDQIARVQKLVDQLSKSSEISEVNSALQVRTTKHSILERAKALLEHVRSQEKAHGQEAYF